MICFIKVEDVRLASCNAHSRRVKDGLTVMVNDISVHQYVCNPTDRQMWLDAGSVTFGPLHVDLVQFIQDRAMTKAKRHFLRKHDNKTKRLWFLWNAEELTSLQSAEGNLDECGCHGGCLFFTLKRRDSVRHGDNLSMPGLMWRPDSFQGTSRFGESLLRKGKVAFDACDRTPDDSPTKMFKFTRGWVHSSPSSTPDERETFHIDAEQDREASASGPSSLEKKEDMVDDDEKEESEDELDGDNQADEALLMEKERESSTTDLQAKNAKGSSVKRTASLKIESKGKVEAVNMTGSSYSLPTTAFRVKVEMDDGNERQGRKSLTKSTGTHSSSESISDSEYYSANEDADTERSKSRTKSVSEASVSKTTTVSPTTTEGTSTFSSAQSPTEEMTVTSLKVDSPSRKVSTSSTISFRSVKSGQKGSRDNIQTDKEETFSGYIPYLQHNQCQEWLKVSPSAVESWRATDPYSQPFCGNFLRTGVMSPPQFHVVQQGLGPSMIAERPRDEDLAELEEEIQEQEESSGDEDGSFRAKGKLTEFDFSRSVTI